MDILDLRTIYLSYLGTSLLGAVVITSLWLRARRHFRGIGLWAACLWVQPVALTLIVLRGRIPDFASIVVSNTMVLASMIVLLAGFQAHLDAPRRHWFNVGYLGVFMAVQTYFSAVQPDFAVRVVNIGIATALYTGQSAWLLLGLVDSRDRDAARMPGVILAVWAVVSLVRIPVTIAVPVPEPYFGAGLSESLVLATYQMLAMGLTYSLVLLVSRRLSTALEEDIAARDTMEREIRSLNIDLERRVLDRTEELQQANAELIRINNELTKTNVRLEAATNARRDFLAAMSHELRTPLNSIIGFSGIMMHGMGGEIGAESARQAGIIYRSGKHLLGLINQILGLSRLEAGREEPSLASVDVCEAVREVAETMAPLATEQGIELAVDYPDLAPICTDRTYVHQILLNLLGNAIKFTERGSVRVTAGSDETGIVVTVEDTGCGIAADDLERVFEDFFQVATVSGVKSDGTGLGLPISRRLATLIGGRITVKSEPGRGSQFTLTVPDLPGGIFTTSDTKSDRLGA